MLLTGPSLQLHHLITFLRSWVPSLMEYKNKRPVGLGKDWQLLRAERDDSWVPPSLRPQAAITPSSPWALLACLCLTHSLVHSHSCAKRTSGTRCTARSSSRSQDTPSREWGLWGR